MSVELVSLAVVPQLGVDLYDVVSRNRNHLALEPDISVLGEYCASDFRRAISRSIEGNPLPEIGLQTDLTAIVEDDVVVGGLVVCTAFGTYQRQRLSFFVDIEGGKARRGLASEAVNQKVLRLKAEDDVEVIEAICSKPNTAARKVLQRAGFEIYGSYDVKGFHRLSLAVDLETE